MSGSEGMRKISTQNGSVAGLSLEQEKQKILGILQEDESQAKEGDTYYLLSLR